MISDRKYLIMPCIALLLCAQFSSQDSSSVAGKERPRVNFYGILIDNTGKKYQVEDITIAGLYKQIPAYEKPNSPDANPDINTTRLDLSEISEIHTLLHEKTQMPIIERFRNREYIKIEVISNDTKRTKNIYIIEKSRRIYCNERNEAGPIEKELSFEALDRLIIEGYHEPEFEDKKRKNASQKRRNRKITTNQVLN